ncbi:MAG: hypothetical protein HYU52_03300, partial [Acidobacteria bacterium]|nr:hypothetical protein [Acidobacteriota bacterium]
MRLSKRTMLAIALTASFAAACAKSEPAAPVAGEAATTTATASNVATAADSAAPQPEPGSPVATFTPSSDTVAPMLPMLGASP